MNTDFLVALLVILLVVVILLLARRRAPSEKMLSSSPEARRILAALNAKAVALIAYLKQKYFGTVGIIDPDLCTDESKINLYKLCTRYNPSALYEAPVEPGFTSYTVDKGVSMYMCLTQRPDTTKFHEENLLTFVLVHEMSHILTREADHPKSFWENFSWLLNEAVAAGLYIPDDYSKNPVLYCGGVNVESSPLFDGA